MFAVLLNFKHLFLYISPAYFIYLLKHYCFTNKGFSVTNFVKLGSVVAAVFLVSFGPFVILVSCVREYSSICVLIFYRDNWGRSFLGCFHSKEVYAMHTGPLTFGPSTVDWTRDW